MRIDVYEFGKVVVNAATYTSDVIIYADRVDSGWWRKEGHRLFAEDLDGVFGARPEVFVIGTGYFGMMSVPKAVREVIAANGIEVIIEKTGKAVKQFNDLVAQNKNVIAALHITC